MKPPQWVEFATAVQAPNIRIVLLDALRGVAVLGIYWINIVVFLLDSDAYALTYTSITLPATDMLTGPVSDVIVEGTMRGLFSILFGASAMVFLSEAKLAAHGLAIVERYYRRTFLLVLFGVLHAYFLLWPYDVLYVYGVFGMFLFPLRKLSPKYLLLLGVVLLFLGDMEISNSLSGVNNSEMNETATSIGRTVEETDREVANRILEPVSSENKTLTDVEDSSEIQHRTYRQLFQKNMVDVVDQQSNKLYTSYLFDVGGMMIVGMALLKLGILSGVVRRKIYLMMMLAGYVFGFMARDSQFYNYLLSNYPLLNEMDESLLGYNTGRLLVTLGHVGIIGLLISYRVFDRVTQLFVNTGRLALTNYIMQTCISLVIFHVFDFEIFNGFDRANLIYICVLVWLFQVAFSSLWLMHFKLGPLEWVWRSLVYGKRQPIRHTLDIVKA